MAQVLVAIKNPLKRRGSLKSRQRIRVRPSRYFYWDGTAGRRLRPDLEDSATAKKAAQSLARAEQNKLPEM
jgi:hypothetical protein